MQFMKQYDTWKDVSPQDVLDVLTQWENGLISDEQVYNFAEQIFYLKLKERTWPEYSEDRRESIMHEVLSLLDRMYAEPILRSDIPALRHFLLLAENSPQAAWKAINEWTDNMDWKSRKNARF
jgi:hypothetical protein